MQYLGGKHRIAKKLTAIIRAQTTLPAWDPFCGGLSMSVALGPDTLSSDSNAALIALYQAVAAGWVPPTGVTLNQYKAAKNLPDSDPLKAYCGFGLSYGGKWFGGMFRDHPGKHTQAYTVAVLRRQCPGRRFACVDWLGVEPRPLNSVLYLDPPYAGTTGYTAVGAFDHDRFWSRAEAWAKLCPVFVSEYSAPAGWKCIFEVQKPKSVAGGNGGGRFGTERLFTR